MWLTSSLVLFSFKRTSVNLNKSIELVLLSVKFSYIRLTILCTTVNQDYTRE